HLRAAMRHLVEQSLLALAQAEQFGRPRGLRLGQFHLAEQGAGDQNRRHAADIGANLFPAPAFLAFDVKQFRGEFGPRHGDLLWRSLVRTAIAVPLFRQIGACHIGGLTPLRPTTMLGASTVPSACFLPATTKIFSPGLRSATAAGSNITTSTLAGTVNFFSPSLYFSTSSLPSLLVTALSIFALVMVLFGIRSHGRWPSPTPRRASGKMWISTAFCVPSGCGIAVMPTKTPCLTSAIDLRSTASTFTSSASFTLIGEPSRPLTSNV